MLDVKVQPNAAVPGHLKGLQAFSSHKKVSSDILL